ncbi:MAG: ferredoxin [Elusimicrobia bacterium]|nr:ferredoxin [Elusimicrobiota bacterium]
MKDIGRGIRNIADFMAVAAKTAPKTRGIDHLVIKIFEKVELEALASKMSEAGDTTSRPQTFKRDAENVRKAECVVVIGVKSAALGLDCGFCGADTCSQAGDKGITCAYNSGDLGIAAGSAVSVAADMRADNRIMYTVGYTVKKYGLLGDDIRMALGIPLSATGKNIFFDRK